MKIDKINNTDYQLYIFNKKQALNIEEVRNILYNLKRKLKLIGFYKVIVCNKKIGTFIEITKIENSYYSKALDLKIIVENDEEIYYKTKDYFSIEDMPNIKYSDDYYYVLVNDNFDRLLERTEFGEFVFGNERLNLSDVW